MARCKLSLVVPLCVRFLLASSMGTDGRAGHGLIGYGIKMYNPPCAFACRAVISSSTLRCSTPETMEGMDMDMGDGPMSSDCYASDDAFLQTLAYCISAYCHGVSTWKLEKYWQANVAGQSAHQPDPKESYQQALAKVTVAPTETLVSGDPLNQTTLVSEADYITNYNALTNFEKVEIKHETYSIVLLVTGAAIPIALSLLRFIPFPTAWATKFNAWFVYPRIFPSLQKSPLGAYLSLPTYGQALFIFYLLAINITLSGVGIHSIQPNVWYASSSVEVRTDLANRIGVLSFANIPLLILYAGRNNVLLQLTNWSYNTFLLLHRWIAWICTIEACLHSAIYLQIKVASGEHPTESKLPYWIWGIVGTLAMSVLLPGSIWHFREKFYELFLVSHIILSIFVVVGCYYHIFYRFGHQWGYEVWLYVAMAVWGFERVMRLVKLARNGVRTATVTVIDDDYVRVDVEGVSGSGHAYLYFPTLTWRVWENHPFSVASTILRPESRAQRSPASIDIEKSGAIMKSVRASDSDSQVSGARMPARIGLTFFVRTMTGVTASLRNYAALPVLVESPYTSHQDLSEHALLVCIVGGVGITTCIPLIRAHPGRVKLIWGVRGEGIVNAMAPVLAGVDKEVFIAQRINILETLHRELTHTTESAAVFVSGPVGMAEEVRDAVSKLGRTRNGSKIKLVEETFTW